MLTGAALVLHLLFPLAPPRMLAAAGLVDTGQVYGPTVYGDTPATDSMANQFAAMPSLHFGWALMVAVGLIVATRSRWRWLWLLHPLVTLLVIVGTANHYWLDAIVVSALLAVALAALRLERTAPVRVHTPWPSVAGAAEPTVARTALPMSRIPDPAVSEVYASSSGGRPMNATLTPSRCPWSPPSPTPRPPWRRTGSRGAASRAPECSGCSGARPGGRRWH